MRILWVPQISSKSINGELLLNTDSNMSFFLNLMQSEFGRCNDVYVAFEYKIPDKFKGMIFASGVKGIFENDERKFTNAYTERFGFDVEYFEKINSLTHFDVVFVNEPTKVIALKNVFKNVKVVSYCHWLAMDNMKEIELRQIEGIIASDIAFFNSNYVITRIFDRYKKLDNIENAEMIKIQPSYVGNECSIKENAKMNIIYNHRLSSDGYYKKAFESLLYVMDNLKEKIKGKDIEMPTVYLTNPSGKALPKEYERPYLKEISLVTKEEYNEFLSSNEILIHLNTFFDSKGMWSMSTVDAACTGNICLLPYKFGYAEIFNSSFAGYCINEKDMARKLYKLLKHKKIEKYATDSYKVSKSENVGRRLNNVLNNLIKRKDEIVVEKPWGSYCVTDKSKTRVEKFLNVKAGESLSLQKHNYKSELWTIVEGEGEVIKGFDLNNLETMKAKEGDAFFICRREYHKVVAKTDMKILEIAGGEIVSESDIERVEDLYGRI